ncbi:H-type lectin domain-containing protein [Xinfangfangia pollutisoli]|uniref:H-type lectin domain-containing protein n=1 Tax=Xinfangfangia pollutisoli TaxID=2865960 RepID=UPI001CD7A0F8|nr:H-type lectin domain-containing protein [Xinfangfangia pollutisoli]
MKRFGGSIGILQGARVLFSDFVDGGPMWTGQGDRESRFLVSFREPFQAPPAVIVGLSLLDIDHKANFRADLSAETVTATGFHIVFRTWGDSRIARIRADWTAIGPLRDEDEWDVP